MQVFIQIKEYEAYFERMLAEKKYNEVENLINYLKDNRDLEIEFHRVLKTEKEFINILFFIQAFWNNSMKTKKINNDNISFNILIDIFNIYLKENSSFLRICKKHTYLLNLINLISIKYAKLNKNFDKIKPILDLIIANFHDKINKRLLCESLRNEGFLNESIHYSSIFNMQLNFGTNIEMRDIERIFGILQLELNEKTELVDISYNCKNKDMFRINEEENINHEVLSEYQINSFVNFLEKPEEDIWNFPFLLNNKRRLKRIFPDDNNGGLVLNNSFQCNHNINNKKVIKKFIFLFHKLFILKHYDHKL